MNETERFQTEVAGNIAGLKRDIDVQALSRIWLREITQHKYAYNFRWLGRPVIQFPQDMAALQELIWDVRPDLIIETGIAHGGSLMLSASLLALLDYCEAAETGALLDPHTPKRKVLGIDIDIRRHNREAIEAHPMATRIEMIEGSSIDADVVQRVRERAAGKRVLVLLDSNHTHDHVLAELEAYAPLVGPGSYCVVYDTLIEDMPDNLIQDRPWGRGDNPKTAVREFLSHNRNFEVDEDIEAKLLITVAPGGYLRRVADGD
ncbi:cephalosporin hydroxylase family protein [Solilutibacter silvestris]|uniref:Cephalosporin hydroxylase n=1 Tax=Solilutibacter silvestris TaxID=1645665 RepID=A0A2K1Q2U8_9GAMM|nr:cephalosporin hydroxylase family protein [Lysobacter silvestris]PNS09301.1 Cephalosporin hydroxylase [Lysobacter silvestris]